MYQYVAGSAVLAGISAYSSSSVSRANAKANTLVSAALTRESNRVRGAQNAFAAAKGSLSRYVQSMNNNATLAAGGEALEANLVNARRREDTLQEAGFESMIRDAEQTGAQAAAAAFSGVAGETSDMVSASTRLMQQRVAHSADRSRDFRLYDDARRAGMIQQQTIRSLDSSLILDSLEYTIDVAQQQHSINPWTATLWKMIEVGAEGMAKAGGGAGGKSPPNTNAGSSFAFNTNAGGSDTNYYGGSI
jgi:hypothetical protein